jgi:hypothetical protein
MEYVNLGVEELMDFCGLECAGFHLSVVVDVATRVCNIPRCPLIHV